jgi:hypothetical protein
MRTMLALTFGMLLLASPASAESVRFPETGDPAFVIQTPDSWTSKPDGAGNMLLVAGDKSASYALTIGSYSGTLDDLAVGAMKVAGASAPQLMGPVTISGFHGYMYDSDMKNDAGTHINVHLVVVKLDATHRASVTRLTIDGISSEDYADANSVLTNTTITAAPPVPRRGRHHR